MTTLELSNPTCRVQISPERGGRIVSFRTTRTDVEHVGPDQLQTWVKTGKVHDPTVGVLHLFHADLHTRSFAVKDDVATGSVTMQAEAEGIVFQKTFRLDPSQPRLTLEYEVGNRGSSPRTVQIETFFNWNFGPSIPSREVVTLIRRPRKSLRFDVKPYGTMGGDAVDIAGASLDLCDLTHHETLRVQPDASWAKYSIYQMSGCWRGPYSVEKMLAPGEIFRASLQLEVCVGCDPLAPTVAAVDDRRSHTDNPPQRSQTIATEPSFPIRVIHLWCGHRPDAFKWLTEHVIAPCGYTHIVLELGTSLRLQSHPELAADGANSPASFRDLARFIRSFGIEVIPAHNFFGHQQATNITRAYPELQEVPGELGVYCPTHPKTRQIVADIVRETLDIIEPRQYHIGHDEIQLHSNGQRVGVCPRCRARKPHEVFAYDVSEIHAQLKAAGVRTWMWGDMIIGPEFLGGFEANGIDGEVYRVRDLLPHDIVIADWHYYTCEDYRSSADFMKRGFDVCPGVWWSKEGIRKYAEYARSLGIKSMMMTTWANPDLANLPVESVLYAARVFRNLSDADDPDIDEQVRQSAQQLWQKWTQWQSR